MKLELSHDTLAQTIYNRASAEDKMLIKKQNFIQRRYEYYLASDVLLDLKGLDDILPHLNKLSLNPPVLAFVTKSKDRAKRKQFVFRAGVLLSVLVLFGFGIQAALLFYDLQTNIGQKKAIYFELKEIKKQRGIAERKAQTLLDGVGTISKEDLQNEAIVKQMLIKYDTLGQEQTDVAQQRDVAQSATLSDLSKKALEEKDASYALKLALKAWELNPENEQAMEIIGKVNKKDTLAFAKLPIDKQTSLVKESQQKVGSLKKEDFRAIFSKDNKVVQNVQNQNYGVKQSVVGSKRNNTTDEEAAIKTPALYEVIKQKKPKRADEIGTKVPSKIISKDPEIDAK
jgi:hypothetical protein